MKTCPKCKKRKPATVETFGRCRTRCDGLNVYCKLCRCEYYTANRDREIARSTAVQRRNVKVRRVYMRAYYLANKRRWTEYNGTPKRKQYMCEYLADYYSRNQEGLRRDALRRDGAD